MKIMISVILLLSTLCCASAQQSEKAETAGSSKLPEFWKSKLTDVDEVLNSVRRGSTQQITESPGGRPVYAVYYGEKDSLFPQANYNSAVAARNPAYFARKDSTTKPVVFFLGPVHGQEVEGIVGLLNLIRVAESGSDFRGKKWPELKARLEQCRSIIIPIANPDGRARCPYNSFVGVPTQQMTKYGQGTRKDGSFYAWPGAKAVHPMQGDVEILGAYFNDDGINPMHDDFFEPMAEETKAILRIVKEEAPDLTVCLHSHESEPVVLQANYLPMFMKTRIADLSARVKARYEGEDLPYGSVVPAGVDDETYPPRKYFNLVSAMHHAGGTMAFTFECSHGSISENSPEPIVDHDAILDIQLCLYDEMLAYILENRLYWKL